ncbi:MAG: hypothetical protein VB078_10505 [Clostridiaceae bacterium]|nr:hypothetical protein [Clostridiaceae bacterium]
MNDWVVSYISRLLIGGFASFCVMAIAGKGPHAEPLRLACACMMIILFLSPTVSGELSLENALDYIKDVEAQMTLEVSEADNITGSDVAKGIEEYINTILSQKGLKATAKVIYTADENSVYDISGIEIWGDAEESDDLKNEISYMTGIPAGNIVFMR